jgi:hypothetical protein
MAAPVKEVKAAFFNKRNEESQSRKTGGNWAESWKPTASKAGTAPARNVFRFMPPHENMPDDGFVETKLHFLPEKGPDGKPVIGKSGQPVPIGIGCLAFYGEDCPACNHVDRLFKQAKAEDTPEAIDKAKKYASSLAAKLRFLINIVDMDHPEKGVQRYGFGPDVEKAIRACWYDDEGEFRNISHPNTGRDIIMLVTKKQGTDFNEYVTVKAREKETKLVDMAWLEQITDLSLEAKKPTVAEIEMALKGERPQSKTAAAAPKAVETVKPKTKPAPEPEPEEEEEEETPPPPKKKAAAVVEEKPKSKRQPIPEPEPEVEEEENSDPYAAARAMIEKAGLDFTPLEITPEETERIKKPTCYTKETELSDAACQGCRVLLPCLTAKLMAEE